MVFPVQTQDIKTMNTLYRIYVSASASPCLQASYIHARKDTADSDVSGKESESREDSELISFKIF